MSDPWLEEYVERSEAEARAAGKPPPIVIDCRPLDRVPITKACGREDCRYSFLRCGRICFECHITMRDFGD